MRSATAPVSQERLAHELIRLLHEGAPAEALSQRLAELEALPHTHADKSALVEAVHMAMAVRNRLELHERREHGLLAVIESAQDLSSRLDLKDLLGAIVARARKLLDSDLAWLSVHDAERGEFRVLIVEGALAQSTAGMVAHGNRGVVSVVMSWCSRAVKVLRAGWRGCPRPPYPRQLLLRRGRRRKRYTSLPPQMSTTPPTPPHSQSNC